MMGSDDTESTADIQQLTDFSEEWAERFGVPEPEMWGFLSAAKVLRLSKEEAEQRAIASFGEGQ